MTYTLTTLERVTSIALFELVKVLLSGHEALRDPVHAPLPTLRQGRKPRETFSNLTSLCQLVALSATRVTSKKRS